MNKEEIKHFKAMLRQGSLRHMNIILDDKFQSELLNIIKDYEKQQLENKKYKEVIDKLNIRIKQNKKNIDESGSFVETNTGWKLIPEILDELLDILKEVE